MNIRGLGAGPKYLALKHLFYSVRPKIILIQESMHDCQSSLSYFRRMFPSWHISAIGACGLSGGLVALWNPLWIRASAYKCFAGILLNASFRGHQSTVNILNVYAPYSHRLPFWDRFFSSDLCVIPHLMLVGDMNFTLGPDEVWGVGREMDPISDFIKARLLQWNLIDIAPSTLSHTWENGRTGDSYIAKRLDRVIMHADIINSFGHPSLSIGFDTISDHRPIFFQWRQKTFDQHFPFKFDHTFMEDPAFIHMVTSAWQDSVNDDPSSSFHSRMTLIRSKVKSWQTAEKRKNRNELIFIQREIERILSGHDPNSMSIHTRILLSDLSRRKIHLLNLEESSWRLKSRISWLRLAVIKHFKAQYSRGRGADIQDILWGIEVYPIMFDDSCNDTIFQPVTEDELHKVLKAFSKDKCPGPDGWSIEFFLCFFELLKHDLLHMIEDSRISGHIHSHISSTLIALIPKKRDTESFSDFRPISLCNISFKIISKIIAERMKGILAIHLTSDQHAFLKGRNIMDAAASTQECIHSIFSNNLDGAILKIDLQKAYDCIDWGFIRCLLAHIGIRPDMIMWIMACIENVNYAININGIPTSFFTAGRGLRQGCPLAPIIFILVMNSLSLHINNAVNDHRCSPIRISRHISLSHNLFVDDILLCAMLQRPSWQCLLDIMINFQKATGLIINKKKSTLYFNGANNDLINTIADMFEVQSLPIRNGISYLGFHLKPKYMSSDWEWLVQRYYNKISSWEFRTLSLAGRVTLIVAVLTQLSVYWAHLFFIPTCIIRRLNQLTACYIWGGKTIHQKFHLARMKDISIPKQQGGWGIKELRQFRYALICRTLWRGIYGSSPWSNIIRQRYMKGKDIIYWYRKGLIGINSGSPIWRSMKKIEAYFISHMRWRIHTGVNIFIGIDPLTCGHKDLIIPDALIYQLHRQGIFTWNKMIKQWNGSTPVWMDGNDLHLQHSLAIQWKSITDSLNTGGIHRYGTTDQLKWSVCGFRRPVTVRDIYSHLCIDRFPYFPPSFPYIFWKATCPPKFIYFSWLVFYNKNLSWENLRKRSWHGPSRCPLCGNDEETNLHIFIKCTSSSRIWYALAHNFGFTLTVFYSIHAAIIWWSRQKGNRRYLILIYLWMVWKWRNDIIFRNQFVPPIFIIDSIMSLWHSIYGSP
eukprot:PITA_10868